MDAERFAKKRERSTNTREQVAKMFDIKTDITK